jgi:hypothetical protein
VADYLESINGRWRLLETIRARALVSARVGVVPKRIAWYARITR